MKKIIALILLLSLIFVGCSNKEQSTSDTKSNVDVSAEELLEKALAFLTKEKDIYLESKMDVEKGDKRENLLISKINIDKNGNSKVEISGTGRETTEDIFLLDESKGYRRDNPNSAFVEYKTDLKTRQEMISWGKDDPFVNKEYHKNLKVEEKEGKLVLTSEIINDEVKVNYSFFFDKHQNLKSLNVNISDKNGINFITDYSVISNSTEEVKKPDNFISLQ